mmetsp:Transcript_128543/g.181324  ORF Transcript_128543/g.181324 Transcript_128543/m.181324 type:complete len:202 (+) Transcript_128543:533-1138(+)
MMWSFCQLRKLWVLRHVCCASSTQQLVQPAGLVSVLVQHGIARVQLSIPNPSRDAACSPQLVQDMRTSEENKPDSSKLTLNAASPTWVSVLVFVLTLLLNNVAVSHTVPGRSAAPQPSRLFNHTTNPASVPPQLVMLTAQPTNTVACPSNMKSSETQQLPAVLWQDSLEPVTTTKLTVAVTPEMCMTLAHNNAALLMDSRA